MLQDNNIEEQLRQLDDSAVPEMENMDAHWQQMEAMLQPTAVPLKKTWPKWMLNGVLGSVVVLMIAAFWYVSTDKSTKDPIAPVKEIAVRSNDSNDATRESVIVDTTAAGIVPIVHPVPGGSSTISKASSITDNYIDNYQLQKALDSLNVKVSPCADCPNKQAGLSAAERQTLLNSLMAALEKPAQQYTIDNSRDTLLQFEEGTTLVIPANSVSGKAGVQFLVKEFYKRSDLVFNKLSTWSNGEQLISGGMLHITAMLDGKEVAVDPAEPLRLYMSDTSDAMKDMQLFNGEVRKWAGNTGMDTKSDDLGINWVPQNQYFQTFGSPQGKTMVRVLNLANMPTRVKETSKGEIGYFLIDDSIQMTKEAIKQALKDRYGYYKVKLRNTDWWETHGRNWRSTQVNEGFNSAIGSKIGDSMWMETAIAEKYKLVGTATTTNVDFLTNKRNSNQPAPDYPSIITSTVTTVLQNKFSVDITQLGWINCDRFNNDSRNKVQFAVNLGDSAASYQTMLVFDRIKSAMNGYISGNQVVFNNVPEGEKVKVISIGINKQGETVYSLTNTITSSQPVAVAQFESTSVSALKASLSKIDE